MKKNISTAIFLIGLISVIAILIYNRKYSSPSPSSHSSVSMQDPRIERAHQSQSIKTRILNTRRPTPPSLPPESSPQCQSFWLQIENYDLGTEAAGLPPAFPQGEECKTLPSILQKIHEDYQKTCSNLPLNNGTEELQEQLESCRFNLIAYRSFLRRISDKNLKIEESTDISALFETMIVSILQKDFVNLERSAKRLRELEPDFYEPVKALMVAKLIPAFEEKDDKTKADQLVEMERILQEARDFGIYDDELIQMDLVVKTKWLKDWDAMQTEGEQLRSEFPTKGFGDYIVAAAAYHRKDFANAKTALDLAVQKEPQNKQYKQSLKGLEKAQAQQNNDENVFQITFGFKVNTNSNSELVLSQKKN